MAQLWVAMGYFRFALGFPVGFTLVFFGGDLGAGFLGAGFTGAFAPGLPFTGALGGGAV